MPLEGSVSELPQSCINKDGFMDFPIRNSEWKSAVSQSYFDGDLTIWDHLPPQRHAVVSALALTIEKRNRGKQREVLAILHLSNDQVYFISVTHTASDIALLLESIGQSLNSNASKSIFRQALEVQVGDHTECTLRFLDENPMRIEDWKIERWRMQRTLELSRENTHLHRSELSSKAANELAEMTSTLKAGLDRFLASLDQDIIFAAHQPGLFCFHRYNYLTHLDPIVRRNRRQAATIFPLIVREILIQRESEPMVTRMSKIIDSGQKIVDWVTKSFRVKPVVAKALRYLSENEIGESWSGKLQSLLFLLSTLPPERYPKAFIQWQVFNEVVKFIKLSTKHPVCSTSTGVLLGEVARRDWKFDISSSTDFSARASCIDTIIKNLGNALAAYIRVENLGTQGHLYAKSQSVASNAIVNIGLRRAESLATKWQVMKRESDLSFTSKKEERHFPILLPDPFHHSDLTIVQLLSQADLSSETACLGHCVENYGTECQRGQSVIFSVRNQLGEPRSTFEIRLNPLSLSAFEINLIQHKRSSQHHPFVSRQNRRFGLSKYLRGSEAIPLLTSFSREKLVSHLEPSQANDFRYALLMITFLKDSTHGRIKFEELIARVVRPEAADLPSENIFPLARQ